MARLSPTMRWLAKALRPGGARNRSATAGAGAASLAIGAVLTWRGELDVTVAIAAALVVALAALRPRATDPVSVSDRRPAELGLAVDLVAAFPDPVILVDRRGIVMQANAAARDMLPVIKDRQPLSFALRAPEVLDAIGEAASGAPTTVVYGGRFATEPTYEVRLRLIPEAAPEEPGSGLVALFFRDLTTERRIETMRVDFVANVSHELRTPLASLLGFIETLQGAARADAAARERFLEIMRVQANRMKRLIDDLLQLSRVEMKAHVPPSSAIDLVAVVRHMTEVMAPLARERGVVFRVATPEAAEVLGDRDELLRLVENLLENGVRYGGSGGAVEVEVARIETEGGAGRVELAVRDFGPGVAPEHIPRLTERFYRVDVAESRTQGGTGLGLAIVKHIVGRHRGRLTIDSELGAGATFRVALPAAPGGAGHPTVVPANDLERAPPVT